MRASSILPTGDFCPNLLDFQLIAPIARRERTGHRSPRPLGEGLGVRASSYPTRRGILARTCSIFSSSLPSPAERATGGEGVFHPANGGFLPELARFSVHRSPRPPGEGPGVRASSILPTGDSLPELARFSVRRSSRPLGEGPGVRASSILPTGDSCPNLLDFQFIAPLAAGRGAGGEGPRQPHSDSAHYRTYPYIYIRVEGAWRLFSTVRRNLQ